MQIDFIPPEFVQNSDPEEIQRRMMNALPDGIDDMPGGFPWDFTMPTALQISELVQFHLVRTMMLMFPMWAWGDWLDRHAEMCGLERRAAGYATGTITVTGLPGTIIKEGSVFATPATDTDPSILFKSIEKIEIGSEGIAGIDVIAEVPGKGSNVPARAVSLMLKPMKEISGIINHEAITGGTDVEDDESLRERIQRANAAPISFVGNDSDYVRWAKEVVGVGSVVVIPEWDGPGTVKLVIIDANGKPGNAALLTSVYDYIVSPEDRKNRLAPIGATVTVSAPEILEIRYQAVVVLDGEYTVEAVRDGFRKNIMRYYEEAKEDGSLTYTQMAAVLSDTAGVRDYTEFLVNEEMRNIPLNQALYPETADISFREYGAEAESGAE